MARIATFDDWTDLFLKWQKDIGFDTSLIPDYRFEALYEDTVIPEVEFGEFAGQKKWERILQIPNQEMRDALLHLIVYQGDTEFASSEQQRHLIDAAPSASSLGSAPRSDASRNPPADIEASELWFHSARRSIFRSSAHSSSCKFSDPRAIKCWLASSPSRLVAHTQTLVSLVMVAGSAGA
ncbi:MAG: hypothetical protein IH796_12165, partial [Deltaproteobacteria bacterium]|nr:hypothetical protein [Deltaproteobacteria bacterium]